MDPHVFLSLLALDSYNRGYDSSIAGLSETDQIGDVSVISRASIFGASADQIYQNWQATGFYAIAYERNGETIISYRGTDNPNPNPFDLASDIWSGWTLGAGFSAASQAGLALAFYDAVDNATSDPIVTVGHSLGGGLAGFVGDLNSSASYGFDHMPFLDAAAGQALSGALTNALAAASIELGQELSLPNLITWLPLGAEGPLGGAYEVFYDTLVTNLNQLWPYEDTMTAYHLDGEALEAVRTGDPVVIESLLDDLGIWGDLIQAMANVPVLGQTLQALGIYLNASTWIPEASVENEEISKYGITLSSVDLHSQALLTTLLFGERQWGSENGGTEWQQSVRYVAPGLLSDVIGGHIGLVKDTEIRADPGDQMAAMVAYSLIDDGERVFGDTAIRVLFDDMDQFGDVLLDLPTFVNEEVRFELGNILAEFAGLLAKEEVLSGTWAQALDGVLGIGVGANGSALNIDFTDTTWSLDNTLPQAHDAYSRITFVHSVFDAAFGQSVDPADAQFVYEELQTWLALREGNSPLSPFRSIDSVSITLTEGQLSQAVNSSTRQLIVGSDGVEEFTITGTPAVVLAGGDNDTIYGTEGDDALIGGDGDDVLVGGGGEDFLAGGSGNDTADYSASALAITMYVGGSSEDLFISVNDRTGDTDSLYSIEHITATGYTDYLYYFGEIPDAFAPQGTRSLTIDMGSELGDVVANARGAYTSIQFSIDAQGSGTLKGDGPGVIQVLHATTQIVGSSFDDEITDLAVHDGLKRIDGGEGDDTITVDGSDAVILGGQGNDVITGGECEDIIYGDDGNDTLNGGDGNDLIVDTSGTDEINGGDGDDDIRIEGAYSYASGDGGNDYIELLGDGANVRGGAGDDVIDVLTASTAFLSFAEGDGHDSVLLPSPTVNWGQETITGTAISIDLGELSLDDIRFVIDSDYDSEGASGIAEIALVVKSTGDSIYLSEQVFYCYTPQDSYLRIYLVHLETADNYDNLSMAQVEVVFGSVAQYRTEPSGNEGPSAPSSQETIGTSGNDSLVGGFGDDSVSGGAGDDTIEGSGGNDTIDGGDGYDTLNLFGGFEDYHLARNQNGDVEVEDLRNGGISTLTGVESIYFVHDNQAMSFVGTVWDDRLRGLEGNNYLFGYAGNDWLEGGPGADTMVGGEGDDGYDVDNAGDIVTESADEGWDYVQASISYTLGANVEGLYLWNETKAINGTGNNLDNKIYGDDFANTLSGLGGNDYIEGGGGDDYLDGGAGADTMIGGEGMDTYYVDDTGDVVIEEGEDWDEVYATVSFTLAEGVDSVIFQGSAPVNGIGNSTDNTLYGNSGDNTLSGLAGNDMLWGGGGDDTLIGGEGLDQLHGEDGADTMIGGADRDLYFVDNINDVVIEFANEGIDGVQSSVSFTLGDHVEELWFTNGVAVDGTGNDLDNYLGGNNLGNILSGLGGDDTILGGGGDDTIVGGDGTDHLVGGAGDDIFVFDTALGSGNIDTIDDFAAGADVIRLDSAVFTGLSAGALSAGAFVIGSAAADGDDRVIYDDITGALLFDADGSGAGAAIQFASLTPSLALSATDFVIV